MSKRADAAETAFWGDDLTDSAALQCYRTLVNAVDDGIYQLDAAGRFTAVNEIIVEMSGYSRDELLGEHVSILLEDEDIERISREMAARVANGERLNETFEITARTAAGETRYFELRVSLLTADGTFEGSVGIVRDITEKKRTEQRLDERKRQLERERTLVDQILETSPVGIQVIDTDGEVTRMNEHLRDLLEIRGDIDQYDPSDRTVFDEDGRELGVDDHPFARTLETGEPVYDRLLRTELPSGDTRWLSVNAAPILTDDGAVDRVVTTGEDVTELKEREAELSTELNEIFGRISDAFYALDEEFRFTHVNERAEELLQHDEEELLGRNLWDVFPSAAELDEVWEAFHTARETQEATSYELYYDTLGFWVEANIYPSETGVSVYFRDVTERKERERALEESERRYRTLAEYFPNGLVTLFDHDLEYTLAAGRGFDRIPVDPEDLEGESFDDVWPDETASDLEPAFQAALGGEEASVELRYADREWVIHAVPITDERGDVFAGMTMAQDITEQKERERYLEDAKAQLEAATEAGAVGTWEWRLPEDVMVTGETFAETFGVDPEAAREGVSSDRFLAAIHEDDRDRVERKIEAAIDACGEYEAEYRVWNADGELRWVSSRGRVECDEDGTPQTFPGALTDITKRKRAELELQRNRDQWQSLFEILPVGVVVADENGGILEVNEAAEGIWGGGVFDADSLDEYDALPVRWADTGEPVGRDEWTIARVLDGEEVTDPVIFEIDAMDGEQRIVSVRGMPIRDERGAVTRAVLTLSDITERRAYQRQLEETIERLEASNERLEHFAYAASHDLQEPLRMVSSYLQLLEKRYGDALDADGEEFLGYAVEGAERMREMIAGLLEYSRIETQGDPFEPTDLETVVEEVRTDLRLRIEESGADICVDDLPCVNGDDNQLRQLFQNLLENAIEYSGDEPPVITIDAERRGDEWEISVRDEGIGIESDEQERIFEVFERLHSREVHDGTGIGLALCQRIVERHGGEIRVESEPGEGTTFTVTLPTAE